MGREPRGGRSAHLGGMPSFWYPSLLQMPHPVWGWMHHLWAVNGTQLAPLRLFPTNSFPRKGGLGITPDILPTRTAYWGDDASLSMTQHLVPSGHVCKFLSLRTSLTSAGSAGSMAGSSVWSEVVAQGHFGVRRARCPLGPGGRGMEQLGQSCSNSWQ